MSDDEGYEYPDDESVEENVDDNGSDSNEETPPKTILGRQVSYTPYNSEGVMKAMRKMISRVADDISLSESKCAILLRHLRWNETALVAHFRAGDLDAIMESAGVAWDSDGSGNSKDSAGAAGAAGAADPGGSTFQCFVCFDEVPLQDTTALDCGHRFCNGCWSDGLASTVDTGGPGGQSALEVRCMDSTCRLTVGEDTVAALLDQDRVARFRHLQALSFVDDNADFRWCPAAGCSGVVAHSRKKKTVACGEGHRFCFSCMGPPHAPVSCEEHKAWAAHLETLAGPNAQMSKMDDVKLCPNPTCGVKTTKVSGCMYLNCTACKAHWCWQCGDWGCVDGRPAPHHVSECNIPPNASWSEASGAAFANDGRFRFYRGRSDNHANSLKFAQAQRAHAVAVHEQVVTAVATQGIAGAAAAAVAGQAPQNLLARFSALPSSSSPSSVHRDRDAGRSRMLTGDNFLLHATDTLIACREVLVWTYVWAFFEVETPVRELFEHSQKDLERFTEQLSALVETRDTAKVLARQTQVVNLDATLRKFLSAMEAYERPGGARDPPGAAEKGSEESSGNEGGGGGGAQGGDAPSSNSGKKEQKSLFYDD